MFRISSNKLQDGWFSHLERIKLYTHKMYVSIKILIEVLLLWWYLWLTFTGLSLHIYIFLFEENILVHYKKWLTPH